MPATTQITLDMCIAEMERQQQYYRKYYSDPEILKRSKITPYERDHRISINNKLLELLYQAKQNKAINGPKFLDLINQLP